MNSLAEIIDSVMQPHVADWKEHALNWVMYQLNCIDVSGAAVLDEGETPELPEVLLKKSDAEWLPEPEIVAELRIKIHEWQSAHGLSDEELHGELQTLADSLREIDFPVSQKLRDTYDAAVEETWIERLMDTNYKDNIRFHRYLREHIFRNLDEMIQWHLAKMLDELNA